MLFYLIYLFTFLDFLILTEVKLCGELRALVFKLFSPARLKSHPPPQKRSPVMLQENRNIHAEQKGNHK